MKQLILLFAFLTSFSMQSFGQIQQSADSDTLNGTTVVSTIDDPDDYWTEEKQLSKGGEFIFNQMENMTKADRELSVEELEIECWAGTYSMNFSDNIIDKSGLKFSTDSDWITLYPYSADENRIEFYVDRLPSVVEGHRTGYIYVTCEVEDEGTVTDVLTVKQFAKENE